MSKHFKTSFKDTKILFYSSWLTGILKHFVRIREKESFAVMPRHSKLDPGVLYHFIVMHFDLAPEHSLVFHCTHTTNIEKHCTPIPSISPSKPLKKIWSIPWVFRCVIPERQAWVEVIYTRFVHHLHTKVSCKSKYKNMEHIFIRLNWIE